MLNHLKKPWYEAFFIELSHNLIFLFVIYNHTKDNMLQFTWHQWEYFLRLLLIVIYYCMQVKNSFIIARKTRGTQLDVTEDIQLFDTETAPRKGETDHDYEALHLICFHRLSKLVQTLELVWSLQIDTSRREGSIWTFIWDQAWKQSQAWIINVDEMEFWTRKLRHCFHMQVLESICIWMRKKGITFLVFPPGSLLFLFPTFLPAQASYRWRNVLVFLHHQSNPEGSSWFKNTRMKWK